MSRSNMVLGRLVGEISRQLAESPAVAKAADVCAIGGHIDRALINLPKIEELIYFAVHLLMRRRL